MKAVTGMWKIVEMDTWDQDYVELNGPGCLQLEESGYGKLCFGGVEAQLKWMPRKKGAGITFSFDGFDEGDQIKGNGFAELEGPVLIGFVSFDEGEESGFAATKETGEDPSP